MDNDFYVSLEQYHRTEETTSERDAAFSLKEKTRDQIRDALFEEVATRIFKEASSELSIMGEVAKSQGWEADYYRVESALIDLLNQKKVTLDLYEKLSGDRARKDILLQVINQMWENLSEMDLNQRKEYLLFAKGAIAELCMLETETPQQENYDLLCEALSGPMHYLEERNP